MKKTLFSFLSAILLPFATLFASHFSGVELSYEYLGNCNYRIYQSNYMTCSMGTTFFPVSLNMVQNSWSCTSYPMITWNWIPIPTQEITQVCPSLTTNCSVSGAATMGVNAYTYYADINLCGYNCAFISFSTANCCREYSITSGAGGQGLYFSLTIPMMNIANSSPKFVAPPIISIPAATTTTLSQAAFDADGDSLVYELDSCFAGQNMAISLLPGYSYLAPMGPNWNVSVNPTNGEVTFAPNTTGPIVAGVVGICVKEYRNGVYLGKINRDMTVRVMGSLTPNDAPTAALQNLTGGMMNTTQTQILAAANQAIEFDILASDLNSSDSLTFSSNLSTFFPNATLTPNSSVNPLTLHFSWTPTNADIGTFSPFFVTIKDNHCPIYGQKSLFYAISVDTTSISGVVTNTACNLPMGAIDLTVGGGAMPYSYLWSNGATTQDLVNLYSGAYWVNITDGNGNVWADTFYVNANNISINFNPTSPNCNLQDGLVEAIASGGLAPYNYIWSNGQINDSLLNVGIGGYSVDVTDGLGCFAHKALILDYDPADSCFTRISGRVFQDANGNCILDAGELGVAYSYVDLNPGGAVLTDSTGYYEFIVQNTGNYTVTSYPFNYGLSNTSSCMPFPLLQNVYVTALGLNAPNINYPVNLLADIGIYMGQYPLNLSDYDRLTYLYCYNWSFFVANPIITFEHDVLMQNPIFTPSPTSYNAATRTAVWNVTNLPPNGYKSIVIETTAPINTLLSPITANVNITNVGADAYPQDNQDTAFCYIGAGSGYSYDPNYKEVSPQGQTQYGFVSPNTPKLTYTIHFQNTGTAPAQYVVVRDTIEVNALQINSIQMQMSSHLCSISVAEDSILIFTFLNINLPDSATDEPNSHGFVKFAINLLPNLPLNTQISNSSSIYFDFNVPVLTNSTLTTLYKNMELAVNDSISVCPTDSILANVQFGKPPYTFSWSNGLQELGNFSGTSKVIANFTNGMQSVWITDAFGMSATQSFQLNLLPVAANVDFNFSTNGNYYFFTPNAANYSAYLWDFGNGQTSSLANSFTTYTQSGTYEVKLIVWDDCGGVDTLIKDVVFVAANNANEAFVAHIRLLPNPFEEVCTFSFENSQNKSYDLIIRDLSGKLVQKIENIRSSEVKIYKESKSKGAYLWELKGENMARGILMIE